MSNDRALRNDRGLFDELACGALEHLPSAVAIKDKQLRYHWINHTFTTLFNVSLAGVVGKTNDEVFPADMRLSDDERERAALSDSTIAEDLDTFFLPDGTIREVLASHAPFVGADGTRWLISTFHDIGDVIDANHSLIEHAEDLSAQTATLRRQALLDPLTEALNRRGLKQRASTTAQQSSSDGVGVLIVDIDDFKLVNDEHGHEAGDSVLRMVAMVLKNRTRSDDDVVARLGGDEFVVLLPDASAEETHEIAKRIGAALDTDSTRQRQGVAAEIRFSVTVGAGHWSHADDSSFTDRLGAVDELLYAAKRAGRGQVLFSQFN